MRGIQNYCVVFHIDFKYPMGHPEVIVEDKTVDWRQPTDNPYKGIIKVQFNN